MIFFSLGDLCCHLHVGNLKNLYFWEHTYVKRQFITERKELLLLSFIGFLFIFFLIFRNQKNIKHLSRLVVRPHTDAVYHACFSANGQRIASCGADKTLQVKHLWIQIEIGMYPILCIFEHINPKIQENFTLEREIQIS